MAQGPRGLTSRDISQQIEPRQLTAWTALANLFPDAEHSDDMRGNLACSLHTTGYSLDELEDMLRREVAPVFGSILLSVAGEWTLWDEGDVAAIMQRELLSRKHLAPSQWIAGLLAYPMARKELNAILRLKMQ